MYIYTHTYIYYLYKNIYIYFYLSNPVSPVTNIAQTQSLSICRMRKELNIHHRPSGDTTASEANEAYQSMAFYHPQSCLHGPSK